MADELNARARHLLRTLVAEYIREGQPVGSRRLSRSSGLDLSAATIRNVMADLEEAGYIKAPHTSAGRVPTHHGYRFFVDAMITSGIKPGDRYPQIEQQLAERTSTSQAISSASDLLSALTSFVGVVTVPKRESFAFRHIDFVRLSERQVLAILVFEDGEIQNRLLTTEQPFTERQLERAANFLNREYAGLKLSQIKSRLVHDMADAKQRMDALMRATIEVAERAFASEDAPDVVVSGQSNLLGCQELADIDTLKSLFDAFQEKREILYLLDECVHAEGVRLYIGEESGREALESVSLVSAPYGTGDEVVGVLGVIGPTRMAYDRVISIVETTADVLSAVLNHKS